MSLRTIRETQIPIVRRNYAMSALPTRQVAETSKILQINYSKQESSNWCWAACLLMVLEKYSPGLEKCHYAAHALLKPCCHWFFKAMCNKPLPLSQVAEEWDYWFEKYSGSPLPTVLGSGQMSFEQIVEEVDQERPVQLLVDGTLNRSSDPPTGAGHLVLVVGYLNADKTGFERKLVIHNPAVGSGFTELAFDYVAMSRSWVSYWTPLG